MHHQLLHIGDFFGSVLSVILIKAIRKDIAIYNDLTGDADDEDETIWKLMHGDVFFNCM